MQSKIPAAALLGLLVLTAGVVAGAQPFTNTSAGAPESAESQSQPSVTVTGAGEVTAAPDKAVVRVSVEALEDDAETAREKVSEDADRVREALRDAGVAEDAVTTDSYRIRPEYDHSRDGRELKGYRASHSFRIEVTPEKAGEVIDVAVNNGADRVRDVRFTLSDETRDELRNQALEQAVTNARSDADAVAAAADVSLAGVRTVDVGKPAKVRPHRVEYTVAASGDSASTSVEPGDVSVTAQVRIVYNIE